MSPKAREEELLYRVTEICLSLPQADRETKGDHAAFLVGEKIFAYYLNNHHGDGIVSICCRVLPGENQLLVNAYPVKFYLPAYIASRGWVGLRLDRASVDWREAAELVRGSYLQVAPKKLASLMKK